MKINIEVHEEWKEEEIRKLLDGFKGLREKQIEIPNPAEGNEYEAYLIEEFKHKFKIILRRGNRQPDKLTYLALDKEAKLPLMRLDVVPDNHAHKNPDGEIIYGTHLHIFTEQYQDKYATKFDINDPNLVNYCVEFLRKFKVIELNKNSVVEMPRFC